MCRGLVRLRFGACGGQRSKPQELEYLKVVSFLMCFPGTEFGSLREQFVL